MAAGELGKMVPGFDFLQGLMKTAGSALPQLGQWIAPTLDPEELTKRIDELRTVQFWLEQNAKLLGTTIQALEVQRMTLSTLKTMNLPVAELSQALTARGDAAEPPSTARPRARSKKPAAAAAGVVDPLQWWGALAQQFGELAAKAVKDSGVEAAKGFAGTMGQQAAEAAGLALKAAAAMPAQAVKQAAKAVRGRKPAAPARARR